MAATLTATIAGSITWTYTNALAGGVSSTNQGGFNESVAIANGTGAAGTANLIYAIQTTLAASANTTLNLNSTPLVDFFGANIVMARVKAILIALTTATTSTGIQVGNGTNPFINWVSPSTGSIQVRNGGFFLLACSDATAYAVTASTGDILKILNNDGANVATLQIAIIGSTA